MYNKIIKSPWEIGNYKIVMDFPNDFPLRPPKCTRYNKKVNLNLLYLIQIYIHLELYA